MVELGYALSSEEHKPDDLVRYHASGDRRPRGRDGRGDDARALPPRARHGREPERAHPRRPLAGRPRGEMLEEAIEVIRLLWRGGYQSHEGKHYRLEEARLYTLPDEPPPIAVAAAKKGAAALAGRAGDALVAVAPDEELVAAFRAAGGDGKPLYGQVTVCWAESEEEARRTAHEWWPNAAVPGDLSQELPLPRHFEQAAQAVSEDDVAEAVVCGPDPEAHLAKIREFTAAGFDHVYVHQIGPDQQGFFDFYEGEILPRAEVNPRRAVARTT